MLLFGASLYKVSLVTLWWSIFTLDLVLVVYSWQPGLAGGQLIFKFLSLYYHYISQFSLRYTATLGRGVPLVLSTLISSSDMPLISSHLSPVSRRRKARSFQLRYMTWLGYLSSRSCQLVNFHYWLSHYT